MANPRLDLAGDAASVSQTHFAARRPVGHPPNDCRAAVNLGEQRPLNDGKTETKFVVVHMKVEVPVDESDCGLAWIEDFQAIRAYAPGLQHAGRETRRVGPQVDRRLMLLARSIVLG